MDSKLRLIHSLMTTAANVHDGKMIGDLLHGSETRVYGDQAYQGKGEVIREHDPDAKDFTNRRCRYNDFVDEVERAKNRTKSSGLTGVVLRGAVAALKLPGNLRCDPR